MQTTTVCTSHIELVESMSALCTSLKWLTRLGYAMVPVSLYMISNIVDLKQHAALNASKIAMILEQLAKVTGH